MDRVQDVEVLATNLMSEHQHPRADSLLVLPENRVLTRNSPGDAFPDQTRSWVRRSEN